MKFRKLLLAALLAGLIVCVVLMFMSLRDQAGRFREHASAAGTTGSSGTDWLMGPDHGPTGHSAPPLASAFSNSDVDPRKIKLQKDVDEAIQHAIDSSPPGIDQQALIDAAVRRIYLEYDRSH